MPLIDPPTKEQVMIRKAAAVIALSLAALLITAPAHSSHRFVHRMSSSLSDNSPGYVTKWEFNQVQGEGNTKLDLEQSFGTTGERVSYSEEPSGDTIYYHIVKRYPTENSNGYVLIYYRSAIDFLPNWFTEVPVKAHCTVSPASCSPTW